MSDASELARQRFEQQYTEEFLENDLKLQKALDALHKVGALKMLEKARDAAYYGHLALSKASRFQDETEATHTTIRRDEYESLWNALADLVNELRKREKEKE